MTPQRHSDEPREATIADDVTPDLVLTHLATLSQPASIRHIAHGMGLKHRGRRFLPRVLQKLKKHGEVEETQGGRFRLAGTKHAKKEAAGPSCRGVRRARHCSGRRRLQMRKLVQLVSCKWRAAMRRGRRPLRNRMSHRDAVAIRILCAAELWHIAMVTLFWCRIRRCRG